MAKNKKIKQKDKKMTDKKNDIDFSIVNMIDAELMQAVIELIKKFIALVNIVNHKILKKE